MVEYELHLVKEKSRSEFWAGSGLVVGDTCGKPTSEFGSSELLRRNQMVISIIINITLTICIKNLLAVRKYHKDCSERKKVILERCNQFTAEKSESFTREGRGQGRLGRAVLSVAHAPFCPPLAAGGRSVNLNAAACSTPAQRQSRRRPASYSVLSVRPRRSSVGQLIGAGAAGRAGKGVLLFRGFGTQKGAQQGDAMSRRKLGSRPQHLSAIQGKPAKNTLDLELCVFMFFNIFILFWLKTSKK